MSSSSSFSLFTSLRYDPALRSSSENSSDIVSFSPSSPFYMLRYHRDRMLEAAQHFEWAPVAQKLEDGKSLETSLHREVEAWRAQNEDQDAPLKIRVLFNRDGQMQADISRTPPVSLEHLYPPAFPPPAAPPAPRKAFTPSPKTGGALILGQDDALASSSPADDKNAWVLTLDTQPTPISEHTLLKTTQRAHYDAARARSVPAQPAKEGQMHEVLLWNEVEEMTEGSFTSAYFYRGGRWVTPPVGVPKHVPATAAAGGEGGEEEEEEAKDGMVEKSTRSVPPDTYSDEGELREPFAGRWGHSVRSVKVVSGSGGQRGTSRRWALKAGLCMEEPISKDTVELGEQVWVSNGVRGFGLGRVVESK